MADGTGSIDLGRTDIGTAVTRSFTVRNPGSSVLTLGTITLAVGVQPGVGLRRDDAGTGAATTFSVRLDAAAAGTFSGTVSFATSDPNQNPFNFTITGTASLVLTLDDNAGGFSATSGWQSYVGAGWQNEIRFKQAGSGSETASWTFGGLNPGLYRVWTTWEPYPNRVTDAAYTVLDGSTAVGTVAVNQQLTPCGPQRRGRVVAAVGRTVQHHREHAGRAPERLGRSRGSVPDRRRRPHRVDRGGERGLGHHTAHRRLGRAALRRDERPTERERDRDIQ